MGRAQGNAEINYEDLAFDTNKVIDKLEPRLGIVCNREQVMRIYFQRGPDAEEQGQAASPRGGARRRAEEDHAPRIPQLHPQSLRGDSQEWFDVYREKMLRGV